jgi:hypothetical protein
MSASSPGKSSLHSVIENMRSLGAERIYSKKLAANDSSRGQYYVGAANSFNTFNLLPHSYTWLDTSPPKYSNFKASLIFRWMDDEGSTFLAPGAQLILYPNYPEVRLSGLTKGTHWSPESVIMERSDADGRLLILGVCPDGTILGYGMNAEDRSSEYQKYVVDRLGVFDQLSLPDRNPEGKLLEGLKEIHREGWIPGRKLEADGSVVDYDRSNGAGYTLEACLGIRPNAECRPDFEGWELKAHSSNPITLFTPEPDGGFYAEEGAKQFIRQHGYPSSSEDGRLNFSSRHRAGQTNEKTNLELTGYSLEEQSIEDPAGGLKLLDEDGNVAAMWSFAKLLSMWKNKHGRAVYVPYERREQDGRYEYRYGPNVRVAWGTDFRNFLTALKRNAAFFDPGSKLTGIDTGSPNVKVRSQWRIPPDEIGLLYNETEEVSLS